MSKYKPITEEMYSELLAQKNRTGMSAITLYRHMVRNGFSTDTINVGVINSWFTRKTLEARPADYKAVIKAYQSLGNVKNGTKLHKDQRVPLDKEFIENLKKSFRPRANFSIKNFLKRSNPPKGLSSSKISTIMAQTDKTISAEHKDFLQKAIILLNNPK